MYQPYIFKLNSGNSNILDKKIKNNLILSSYINLPLTSLVFNTYIHRTRNAMTITKNMETNNKIYYVLNPFEYNILNYDESILNLTKKYLNMENTNDISRNFYKIWEILFMFNIINSKMTLISLDYNETFINSIIKFKEKLSNGIKEDNIYYCTSNKDIKIKSNVINLVKIQDNDFSFIDNFKTKKIYANLITANIKIKWNDNNIQEQEAYKILLYKIISALQLQAENGHFVIKIYDIYTMVTIKILYLLSSFYEETYIFKPFLSRISNTEKYVICKKFKYKQNSEELNTKIKSFFELFKNIINNSDKYIYDIYPDLIIEPEYINKIKFINIKLTNPQLIMINQIVKYITENNYFGEKYHIYKNNQIDASKWWLQFFFPVSNNIFIKNKEETVKIISISLEKNNIEEQNFIKKIV